MQEPDGPHTPHFRMMFSFPSRATSPAKYNFMLQAHDFFAFSSFIQGENPTLPCKQGRHHTAAKINHQKQNRGKTI